MELQLLDHVCLLLASQSTESCSDKGITATTYAAALDRTSAPVSFVLATKGGQPTRGQQQDTQRFFDALSQAQSYQDMRDFIIEHCQPGLTRLRRKVTNTDVSSLKELLWCRYLPKSKWGNGKWADEEIDTTHSFVEALVQRHGFVDVREILDRLIDGIQTLTSEEVPPPPPQATYSFAATHFDSTLSMVALLLESNFMLQAVCDAECREVATKYQRRLEKFINLQDAALFLVKMRKRFLPLDAGPGSIPYRFAKAPITTPISPPGTITAASSDKNETQQDSTQDSTSILLCSSPLIVAQRLVPTFSYIETELQKVTSQLLTSWSPSVLPQIHPEIPIILDMERTIQGHIAEEDAHHDSDDCLDFSDWHLPSSSDWPAQTTSHCIGTSQRTCHCCCAWIESYNSSPTSFDHISLSSHNLLDLDAIPVNPKLNIHRRLHNLPKPHWKTSQVGGKHYMDWKLSGTQPRLDKQVIKCVEAIGRRYLLGYDDFSSIYADDCRDSCINLDVISDADNSSGLEETELSGAGGVPMSPFCNTQFEKFHSHMADPDLTHSQSAFDAGGSIITSQSPPSPILGTIGAMGSIHLPTNDYNTKGNLLNLNSNDPYLALSELDGRFPTQDVMMG